MNSSSDDLFKHIAISAALPEIFHNFRVFTFENIQNNSFCPEIYLEKEYYLNGWKMDKWHIERMKKIYEHYNEKGNMKINLEEIFERLENKHFTVADIFAKKVYDLVVDGYIVFYDVYNEENYLNICLDRFVGEEGFDWKGFGEIVSIVTIILDNLLTTYLVNSPSRQIKLNFINLDKINLNENEILKLKEYIEYYSLKTSVKLAKERGKFFDSIIFDIEKKDEFNWNVLISEIKINGLRNEIVFSIKQNVEIVDVDVENESIESEPESEMDYYFSRPKKLKTIDDDDMAPVIKGMKGAKEMCPVCFSYNVTYEAGVMCCNDCGWSACTIS